jgi:HSP20 family protein
VAEADPVSTTAWLADGEGRAIVMRDDRRPARPASDAALRAGFSGRQSRGDVMDFKSLVPFGRSGGLSRAGADADPFSAMRREMDRLFDSFTRDWSAPAAVSGSGFLTPKVNVSETDKGLEMTAELPGIDQKDISLDIADNVLTLKAEQSSEKEEKDEKRQYHLIERSQGTYMRRFALPFEADEAKVEATFDKGVLKVVVPRSADAERPTRKIEIKGAA